MQVGHSILRYAESPRGFTEIKQVITSPNDIHNSEKLRNRFWSGSAILIAAPLYVSCKNPHPQSKFRPIAYQIEALSFFFSSLLVRTIILKKIIPVFGVLAAFYKFHWTSKLYAALIMGNRFLGVQISII